MAKLFSILWKGTENESRAAFINPKIQSMCVKHQERASVAHEENTAAVINYEMYLL